MTTGEQATGGGFHSVKAIFRTAGALLHNRIELLAVELQEEEYRIMELLLLAGVALLLGIMALVLFTGIIIFLFEPQHRLYAAVALCLIYSAGAGLLGFRIKERLRAQPFSETIDQIRKDRDCLLPPN